MWYPAISTVTFRTVSTATLNTVTFSTVALSLISILMLGCERVEVLGKVHGKVTFEGQPVNDGLLLFSDHDKGIHMTAELGPDGAYELQTARGFGLPLGTYQIAVNPPIHNPPMPGMPTSSLPKKSYDNIPPKYYRAETSGLTVTVMDGDNLYNIDMKSAE